VWWLGVAPLSSPSGASQLSKSTVRKHHVFSSNPVSQCKDLVLYGFVSQHNFVITGNGIEVVSKSAHWSALSEGTHSFSYDQVFGQNASTEHLYAAVPQTLNMPYISAFAP
jgi:hypothetical protein